MRVAICQSNYFPWKGYFDLIHDADLFIFLDCVQYTKRDWRHRNRIKFHTGTRWIRASVKEDVSLPISEIEFKNTTWKKDSWEALHTSYKKAPYFDWVRPLLHEAFLETEWKKLSEFNQHLTKRIAYDYLGMETKFAQSSDFGVTSKKQELILDLIKAANATSYVSGPVAKDYLEEDRFKKEGIELIWKDYRGYPEYEQSWPPFEHEVSILDLLVHVGPKAPDYIWGWRK